MKKSKIIIFFIFVFFVITLSYLYYSCGARLMPVVLDKARLEIQTDINAAIKNSISDYYKKNNVTADKFYTLSDDGQMINVNTVFVNDFTDSVAASLDDYLNKNELKRIYVPIGALFGINGLNNFGFNINVAILPAGASSVDYNTRFSSAGINQTDFKVTIKIDVKYKIVNPNGGEVDISRDVPVIDTVIKGAVPNYLVPGTSAGAGK